jgi:hypothetical protein
MELRGVSRPRGSTIAGVSAWAGADAAGGTTCPGKCFARQRNTRKALKPMSRGPLEPSHLHILIRLFVQKVIRSLLPGAIDPESAHEFCYSTRRSGAGLTQMHNLQFARTPQLLIIDRSIVELSRQPKIVTRPSHAYLHVLGNSDLEVSFCIFESGLPSIKFFKASTNLSTG